MSNNALSESFDNGSGALGNSWNVDYSTKGEAKLSGGSGLMEWGGGSDSGHGYGTYTITAKADGSQPGPGIILWPGDNSWPGQEIDMLEITPDGSGRQYGTVHWNAGGSDAYAPVIFDGVGGGWHQYQMVWEPGKITFKVDGSEKGSVTGGVVPADHDHGGMNNTIGFLNNNPNTSLTVSQVDFSPSGGGSSSTPSYSPPQETAQASKPAATTTESTTDYTGGSTTTTEQTTAHTDAPAAVVDSGPVDWNAIAAQVTANYEATGHWFM